MTDLTWVLSSCVLILAVIAIRAAFGKRMRPELRYALWGLVLLRLLYPGTVLSSPVSVRGVAEKAEVVQNFEAIRGFYDIEYMDSGSVEGYRRDALFLDDPATVAEQVTPERFERMETAVRVRDVLEPIWRIGMIGTAVVFLASNLRFYQRLRKRRKPLDADCPLCVYSVENLSSSCLFGGAIYVAAETAADETRLRHVLVHELSHYRNGDHVWALLRCAALALHWYNPLVWWAAALSRQDSELCADAGALKRLGEEEYESYGATLIELSARRAPEASLLCTATTMTNGRKSLKERVTMIARRPHMTVTVVCAVVLIAAVAAGCAFTGAVTEDEPPLPPIDGSEDGIPNSDGQGENGQGTQGTTSGSLNILTPEQKAQKIIDDLPGVPLSEEEIAAFNEMFTSVVVIETDRGITPHAMPVSCFFTSFYDDVTELDFLNFLWYHPKDGGLREEDAAEFEALSRHPDFHFKRPDKETLTVDDLPVPVTRILRSSVDETLQTYAGITTADLKNAENVIYLPEYDAYYVFTSDFGPGMFECEGGKRDGETAWLWRSAYKDGSRVVLTLREADGSYLIKAHQITE